MLSDWFKFYGDETTTSISDINVEFIDTVVCITVEDKDFVIDSREPHYITRIVDEVCNDLSLTDKLDKMGL